MNKNFPKIDESVEQLQQFLKAEKDVQKRQRLQILYLIKTNQANSRLQLASLLSLHRHTISSWLNLYEEGGLQKLLTLYIPSGKKSILPASVIEDIKMRLKEPGYFYSYGEIQSYLEQQHQIHLSYSRVHSLVRYQLQSKLKRKSDKADKVTS